MSSSHSLEPEPKLALRVVLQLNPSITSSMSDLTSSSIEICQTTSVWTLLILVNTSEVGELNSAINEDELLTRTADTERLHSAPKRECAILLCNPLSKSKNFLPTHKFQMSNCHLQMLCQASTHCLCQCHRMMWGKSLKQDRYVMACRLITKWDRQMWEALHLKQSFEPLLFYENHRWSNASTAEKHVGSLLITDAANKKTPPNSSACLKITERQAGNALSSDPWSRAVLLPGAYIPRATARSFEKKPFRVGN